MYIGHPFLKKIWCWMLKLFDGGIIINFFPQDLEAIEDQISMQLYSMDRIVWVPVQVVFKLLNRQVKNAMK